MKIFLIIILFFLISNKSQTIETKIIHKIQNKIITNIDIKNEFKYLVALNNSLKELDNEMILRISNESIIRETVKKIEVSKHYKKMEINDEYTNILLKNMYSQLGLMSLNEFETYLKDYDLNLSDVKKKITIDSLWNELIIKKYDNQVTINNIKIKNEISKNKNTKSKEYKLSEIIFDIKNKEEIKKKYEEVIKSIDQIGFENSASIYSFSDSAKIGGDIGWIKESSLNNNIKKTIDDLKVGEISKAITLPNGILILKIQNIKNSLIKFDLETEYKKAIKYERNRQLSQFSKIYYNKVKKNLDFNG